MNALVVPMFDAARVHAQRADEARQKGQKLGPLHGVPITIKEMFDLVDTATTAGIPALTGKTPAADAPVVSVLREAGAVILGKTNVPQAGLMFETDNPIFGRTNNPWNLARSPGGSSGGEGALIAAGGSPLGLASDGGGSLRNPCHCCGLHGIKPTSGRLPMRGHWLPPNWRLEWVQPGPMARCVADLHLTLRVLITAADGRPASGVGLPPLGDPGKVSLNALRIGTYVDDGIFRPSPAVRRAVEEACTALRQLGAQVEEFRPPDVLEAERIYFALFYSDGLDALRHMTAHGKRDWRIRRLFLFARLPGMIRPVLGNVSGLLGRRYESLLYGWVCKRRRSPAECEALVREEAAYRRHFLSHLDAQRLDALICPTFGLPALPHGTFYGAAAGSYALLYNLLGMPAGVVAVTRVRPGEECDRPASKDPVERSAIRVEAGSAGLPIGVQVVARHWREDVVLAVMAALEREFEDRPDYPARPDV